ncbi:MAG: PfkB family carbohydrate kinase [Clostridia bacterium]|nr:PfkB family carbohydrate kinase [Clostridia bacterium]
MSRLLFIGSVVADVLVRIPSLPHHAGDDLHVSSQKFALGGCGYNAFLSARQMGGNAVLFAPVGTGLYGEWVQRRLAERGITSALPQVQAPNGCCYCLVEDDGERTFLSDHGAEYLFRREWFDLLGDEVFDGVYICGLEIEEATGGNITAWLEEHPPRQLFFAPGPRITRIDASLMERIFALHPILHLNDEEVCAWAGTTDVEAAALALHRATGGSVIVTLGKDGTLVVEGGSITRQPGVQVTVADTIGAGDSHIGAVMAFRSQGFSLQEAAAMANHVSAQVVAREGAGLPDDEAQLLYMQLMNGGNRHGD